VLALIAAAGDPATTVDTAERVRRAYFPWIASLSSLLDSVADHERDLGSGDLNFVSQYSTQAVAIERLQEVTARSIAGARGLARGERHVVLVVSMIAMQVSDSDAWRPSTKPASQAVLRTADAPAMPLLLPLLSRWRRARGRADYEGAVGAAPTPIGQLTPVPPSPQ
jgi:tetraprenyl-beta-curcumene synthase